VRRSAYGARRRVVVRPGDDPYRDGPRGYDHGGRARQQGMPMVHDAVPRPGPGRPDGLGKAIGAERACAIRHGQAMRQPGRRAIGQHSQHLTSAGRVTGLLVESGQISPNQLILKQVPHMCNWPRKSNHSPSAAAMKHTSCSIMFLEKYSLHGSIKAKEMINCS
jgi:hypothetical protein